MAIRHVAFEYLGIFDAVLPDAGDGVRYHDLDGPSFATLDPLEPDLPIVLGGPVGVYQTERGRDWANPLTSSSVRDIATSEFTSWSAGM